MSKFAYRKSPKYAAFSAYMDAPFSELPENDGGRNDPRRMCFIDDMGVPEELIFHLWQASRHVALEEAREAVHGERLEDPSKNPDDVAYDIAIADCENAIRQLAEGGKHE